VLISADGQNWTRQTNGISTVTSLVGVMYGHSEFVAWGTAVMFSSPDGSNWNAHTSSPLQVSSVIHAGNHFMSVGGTGSILESDAVGIALAPTLAPIESKNQGSLRFTLTGSAGQLYLVQASANLADWAPLSDVIATNTAVQIEDPYATNSAFHFYRAVVP
jgi:hypothetical protein